jgi:hypothetical protein
MQPAAAAPHKSVLLRRTSTSSSEGSLTLDNKVCVVHASVQPGWLHVE